MSELVDFVERRRTQLIVAAYDRAFAAQDSWPISELLSLIRHAAPGATDQQIACILKAAMRCDIPPDWLGDAS